MHETTLPPPRQHLLDLRVPPVVLLILFGGLAWLGRQIFPSLTFLSSARLPLAVALAGAGIVLGVLGVVSFRRAGTTVNPIMPQSSTTLVVGGVYRFTRNPMYLGLLALLSAWVMGLGNALGLLVLPAFIGYMNRFQIRPEEAALRIRFGDAFTAYAARVRRWL